MKKKKRYRVVGEVTITVSLVVEAYGEEAAKILAEQAPMMSLCNQCAHGEDDEWSTSGELDGEPRIVEVREVNQ